MNDDIEVLTEIAVQAALVRETALAAIMTSGRIQRAFMGMDVADRIKELVAAGLPLLQPGVREVK